MYGDLISLDELLDFYDINTEKPKKNGNKYFNMITCPMGYDNLMVSPNGNFHMCNNTDETFVLGNYKIGLDKLLIKNHYIEFFKVFNREICKNCWAIKFCKICAAQLADDDKFYEPNIKECNYLRKHCELRFTNFINLSLKNKELLKSTKNRYEDKKREGLVDINKLNNLECSCDKTL